MRLPQVLEFSGFGRTQLLQKIASGEFPKPTKLSESGRAIGWDEEELLQWKASRLAARETGRVA